MSRASAARLAPAPRPGPVVAASLIAGLAAVFPVPRATAADCVVSSPGGGRAFLAPGSTLTIGPGGTIASAGTAPNLCDLFVPPTAALVYGQDSNRVTNEGVVEWTGAPDVLQQTMLLRTLTGSLSEVVNTGRISANAERVPDGGGPGVDLVSVGVGFTGDGDGVLRNSGDGIATGIVTGAGGVLFVGAGGALTGVLDGEGQPTPFSGRIEGLNGPGLLISGRLTAPLHLEGTIRGTIYGVDIADLNGQEIVNGAAGLIEGDTTAGLIIVDGTGRIVNEAGGQIRSTGATALISLGGAQTVENAGDIASDTFNAVELNALSGTLENSGTIDGGNAGVLILDMAGQGVVNRTGGIVAGTSSDGLYVGGGTGTVVNEAGAEIASVGGFGLRGDGGSSLTVTNDGEITSNGAGLAAVALAELSGTFTNSGTIAGAGFGASVTDLNGQEIVNRAGGVIEGAAASALTVTQGVGRIVNEAGAIIRTASPTPATAIAYGSSVGQLQIDNAGLLSGRPAIAHPGLALIANSGQIVGTGTSNGNGIELSGELALVQNLAGGIVEGENHGLLLDNAAGLFVVENAAGAVIAGDTDGNGVGRAIRGVSGRVIVENLGTIDGDVVLGASDDTVLSDGPIAGDLLLGAGDDIAAIVAGGVTGAIDGGDGTDTLAVTLAADVTGLGPGDYVNFETVTLDAPAATTPNLTIDGALAIDTGGGSGTAIDVQGGNLSLVDPAASVRAERIDIGPASRLAGIGTVIGNTTVAGTIAPGNSIGTLTIAGDYIQSGVYELEFRAPPAGLARGRNVYEGTAATPAEQDADLIVVIGTADLSAGTVRLLPLSTPEAFESAAQASPTRELRYLILVAEGGLGGTSFAALTNDASGARLETAANPVGGDPDEAIELVLAANAPVVIVSGPPETTRVADSLATAIGQRLQDRLTLDTGTCPSGGPGGGTVTAFSGTGTCLALTGGWDIGRLDRPAAGSIDFDGGDFGIAARHRIGDAWMLGAAFGLLRSRFDVADAGQKLDTYYLTAEGGWSAGDVSLRSDVLFAHHRQKTARSALLDLGGARISGKAGVDQIGVGASASWLPALGGGVRLGPTAGLAWSHFSFGAMEERDGLAENFRRDGFSTDGLRSLLGLGGETHGRIDGTPVQVTGFLGWRRQLDDAGATIAGGYEGGGGTRQSAALYEGGRSAAVARLGIEAALGPGAVVSLGYGGEAASDFNNHAFTLGAAVRF